MYSFLVKSYVYSSLIKRDVHNIHHLLFGTKMFGIEFA